MEVHELKSLFHKAIDSLQEANWKTVAKNFEGKSNEAIENELFDVFTSIFEKQNSNPFVYNPPRVEKGHPMSMDESSKRLKSAIINVNNGHYITQEEVDSQLLKF